MAKNIYVSISNLKEEEERFTFEVNGQDEGDFEVENMPSTSSVKDGKKDSQAEESPSTSSAKVGKAVGNKGKKRKLEDE